MAKSILPYVVLGASAALDNPNINLLFVTTRLKLTYPSPFILSVLNALPPQAESLHPTMTTTIKH
jgi:hypothetical protein